MAFFSKRKGQRNDTVKVDDVKVAEIKLDDVKADDVKVGNVKVEDVKVATTTIVSSYNDGSGRGPQCVKWYFLVREVDRKYYEIFSDKQIEKESETHHDGVISNTFDTPYIEKLEPLTKYLRNPNEKFIELQLLFDFILAMNVKERLCNSNMGKG